jgi:23S rRNA pseudouridine2605 synthase
MRVNKYLALCGVASRRNSDTLISEGRVRVNGRECLPGKDVTPGKDVVTVDGKKVFPIENHVYLMMNKPKGYVTTTSDDKDRKTVLDIIKEKDVRIFPVGRLDYDTEGLLLLTTDGRFANLLTHPAHEIPKTYVVRVRGEIREDELSKLKNGIVIDGEKTKKCRVSLKEAAEGESRIEVVISEGRNRQVRRMFETLGREVVFLKRTAVGKLKLGGLPRGEYRRLTPKEIGYFLIDEG